MVKDLEHEAVEAFRAWLKLYVNHLGGYYPDVAAGMFYALKAYDEKKGKT